MSERVQYKIFGHSNDDNNSVAERINTQIDYWKTKSLKDDCKVINIESIDLTTNNNGLFAKVSYTYSIIFKKEILIEKVINKKKIESKSDRDNLTRQQMLAMMSGPIYDRTDFNRERVEEVGERIRDRNIDNGDFGGFNIGRRRRDI